MAHAINTTCMLAALALAVACAVTTTEAFGLSAIALAVLSREV